MADMMSILQSNYLAVASQSVSQAKYVDVDPKLFEGSWVGKYADNQSFRIQVSDVTGFRAKVKYQSGTTVKYQQVLIRDNGFRVGDSKFVLTRTGVAQVSTVMTNAATGASTLETAFASQKT